MAEEGKLDVPLAPEPGVILDVGGLSTGLSSAGVSGGKAGTVEGDEIDDPGVA